MSPYAKFAACAALFAVCAAVVGASVAALFSSDPRICFAWGLCVSLLPLPLLARPLCRWEGEETFSQLEPVTHVVEACGPMPRQERQFQTTLLNKIARDIELWAKPEFPLRSGTRIDGWFRHEGDDWYITIKRGLDNQQRLTLQGEIEDIILHAPAHGTKLWIVVVIGCERGWWSPAFRGQMAALATYAGSRNARSRAFIHIVPVPQAARSGKHPSGRTEVAC